MKHIKYFNNFNESNTNLGIYVKSLLNDDSKKEYILNIINRFTNDIPQDIDLENAINILDDNDQKNIKYQIDQYLKNGLSDKEPSIIANVELNESISSREDLNTYYDKINNIINDYINKWEINPKDIKKYFKSDDRINRLITKNGLEDIKGVKVIFKDVLDNISEDDRTLFTSFCKSLTALGQKDTETDNESCPKEYLFFYLYSDIPSDEIKIIFNRFNSLRNTSTNIESESMNMYIGINLLGGLEFGFYNESNPNPIRTLKLSQSNLKWLMIQELKSIRSLKKQLVELTINDISILSKIKNDMFDYIPNNCKILKKPILKDRIFSFFYTGITSPDDYDQIKRNFIDLIKNKQWGDKILISVKIHEELLTLHIKLK